MRTAYVVGPPRVTLDEKGNYLMISIKISPQSLARTKANAPSLDVKTCTKMSARRCTIETIFSSFSPIERKHIEKALYLVHACSDKNVTGFR